MSSSCLLPVARASNPTLALGNVPPQPRRGSCQKIGDFLRNFLFFTGLRAGEGLKTIWNWQVSLVSHSQLEFLSVEQIPYLSESQARKIALNESSSLRSHLSPKQLVKILAGSNKRDGDKIKALIEDRKLSIEDVKDAAIAAKWKNTEDNYKDNDPYQFLKYNDVEHVDSKDFWRLTPDQIKHLTINQIQRIENRTLYLRYVTNSESYGKEVFSGWDICKHLSGWQRSFITGDHWNKLYDEHKDPQLSQSIIPDMIPEEAVLCIGKIPLTVLPESCYPYVSLCTVDNRDLGEEDEGRCGHPGYTYNFEANKLKWELIYERGKDHITDLQYAIALEAGWIRLDEVPTWKQEAVQSLKEKKPWEINPHNVFRTRRRGNP